MNENGEEGGFGGSGSSFALGSVALVGLNASTSTSGSFGGGAFTFLSCFFPLLLLLILCFLFSFNKNYEIMSCIVLNKKSLEWKNGCWNEILLFG